MSPKCINNNEELLEFQERLRKASSQLESLKQQHNRLVAQIRKSSGFSGSLRDVDPAALFLDAGPGPSAEYENLRRRVYTNTKEFWYFINHEIGDVLHDAKYDKLQYVLDQGSECKRSLLVDMQKLAELDGYQEWRQTEAANVSDPIQRRLHYLQNPSDCREARKLICNLNKARASKIRRNEESSSETENRLSIHRQYVAQSRARESSTERSQRLAEQNMRTAQIRARESSLQRSQRLAEQNVRARESSLERSQRLTEQNLRTSHVHARESSTQRLQRLEEQNIRNIQSRTRESSSERFQRLQDQRERQQTSRARSRNQVLAHSNRSAFRYDPQIDYAQQSSVQIGDMNKICPKCSAKKWVDETNGMCCASGKRLRAEEYIHLRDALNQDGNVDPSNIGQRVILPSSFTGSPRYLHENQDAMTYVRNYGRPDLFVTFTCNPEWPEIKAELLPDQRSFDRHDIISRVFHLKMKKFLNLFVKDEIFGKVKCYMASVEWQKRGLPHCHLLFWLETKIQPDEIDSVIVAELPNQQNDPILYDIVTKIWCTDHAENITYQHHLAVHLENGQRVYFTTETAVQVAQNPRKTTLLAFFELCNEDEFAKTLLYHEVPQYYTWANNKFTRRKRGENVVGYPGIKKDSALGRVYGVHPSQSECFYLRMLLHHVRGPTSFQYLKTVDGVLKETYQAACRARDDLCEDIRHRIRQQNQDITLPYNEDIYNEGLIQIENKLLQLNDKSLSDFGLPSSVRTESNAAETMTHRYDTNNLTAFVNENLPKLVPDQRHAFETIVDSVIHDKRKFSLDAPGGTGKTFLANLILAKIRQSGKIAIAVASSGIAATLLKDGKTAHSTFKLPLSVNLEQQSTCSIRKMDLLRHASRYHQGMLEIAPYGLLIETLKLRTNMRAHLHGITDSDFPQQLKLGEGIPTPNLAVIVTFF
ncbi:Alpha-(1,6)-fucosyltransferase [Eumeta japonica]|uniref:ATP-dependent DNA helicase n=1 Tax=Eumeta variegata TaxID=151549 RepID=A0A4C1UZ79_EUMVA|nr:Alpha-(1,6)-fucosyltransferase [Eumeta japonica]